MALKEKTIELNLTREVANVLGALSKQRVSVWAPTPHQEAQVGFDAMVHMAGFALLIQYKAADRLHQGTNEWRFKLNWTDGEDQHARLCAWSAAGIPTFYALPLFDDYAHIRQNTQSLRLLGTPLVLWIDPLRINVPNGGVGRHMLGILNAPPHTPTVRSDPVRSDPPPDEFLLKLAKIGYAHGKDSEGGRGGRGGGRGDRPPEPPDSGEGGERDGEGTGLVGFHIG